uniref:Uncharacterized protein n=1 Tax=Octopus bimaculoides TaxID=37653 RepID=A0A0L8ID82_OCTBM
MYIYIYIYTHTLIHMKIIITSIIIGVSYTYDDWHHEIYCGSKYIYNVFSNLGHVKLIMWHIFNFLNFFF